MDSGFAAIRSELGVPGRFPSEVLSEAAVAEASWPELDLRELPFVTLDPPGAKDLDQAVHLTRRGSGYRVWYAIADVPAFVAPGGAVDAEAHRRGLTHYSPDKKTPLHPPVISEDRASLLPGGDRPAYVWQFDLDSDGRVTSAEVRRAIVRNRAALAYDVMQHDLDAGRFGSDDDMALLAEVGALRRLAEADRGGVSLSLPRQLVVRDEDGYRLTAERPDPIEGHNAQISLMTGMAAADMMLTAGIGILRVMPDPSPRDLAKVRAVASTLGLSWPDDVTYQAFVRGLDPNHATTVPMMTACTTLMRGAAYAVVTEDLALERHAAVAAPYAHVTAPLRRLVDRYGLATCAAMCAGGEIPEWVSAGLAALPDTMRAAASLNRTLERANVDFVEAGVLQGQEGSEFAAVGVSSRVGVGTVHVVEPGVIAQCEGDVPLGEEVIVRLDEADLNRRTVKFSRVSG